MPNDPHELHAFRNLQKYKAELHEFRGQHLTVKEIASALGVNPVTIYRRIRLGHPLEGLPRKAKVYEFRGRLATIKEIMAETGLSHSKVSKRTDGKRFYERHELHDQLNEPHPLTVILTHDGISDSINGWARRTGIPRQTIHGRINRGWSIDKTLTTPASRKRNARAYTFKGETHGLTGWAKRLGINHATLRERIALGWPIERALTTPVMTNHDHYIRKRNLAIIRRIATAFKSSTPIHNQPQHCKA